MYYFKMQILISTTKLSWSSVIGHVYWIVVFWSSRYGYVVVFYFSQKKTGHIYDGSKSTMNVAAIDTTFDALKDFHKEQQNFTETKEK